MTWKTMLARGRRAAARRRRRRRANSRRRSGLSGAAAPLRTGLRQLSSSLQKLTVRWTIVPPTAAPSSAPGNRQTAGERDRRALLARIQRLQRENENLLSKLRELRSKELPAFCASAHDLKTPLCTLESVVDSLVQSITDERTSAEVRNLAQLVELTSRRMRSLVDDILDLGRVGVHDDDVEVVDLGELVAKAVDRHAPSIRENDIEVRIAAPLPVVHGPRRDLSAVIANIVENAVKYGPTNRAHVIRIGADRTTTPPLVWVHDNGRGFDPAKIDAVFEPYVRCNADIDGTGLGLAIVKKAVEGWGGQVRIDTEPDAGTTVYFTTPSAGHRAGVSSRPSGETRMEIQS